MSINPKFTSNNKGSALIIVMALAFIVILMNSFLVKKYEAFLKGTVDYKSSNEKYHLIDEMEALLTSPKSCEASFAGHNPNNTPQGAITDIFKVRGKIDDTINNEASHDSVSDIVMFHSDTNRNLAPKYGNFTLQISGFSLESSSNILPNSFGTTNLNVEIFGSESSHVRFRRGVIRLRVETGATGLIVRCESLRI